MASKYQEKRSPGTADEELVGTPMGGTKAGEPGLSGGDAAFLARVNAVRKDVAARMKAAFGAQTADDFKAATGYASVSEALQVLEDEVLLERVEAYIRGRNGVASESALNERAREQVSKRLSELFGKGGQAAFKAATGFDFWASAIQSGMTREQIVERVEAHIASLRSGPTPPAQTPPQPPARGPRDTMTIQGKQYLVAEGRVAKLRKAYPGACIRTEMISYTEEEVVFRAEIVLDTGQLLATGHARATKATSSQYKGRIIEKAETASVSRALAFAGFGSPED